MNIFDFFIILILLTFVFYIRYINVTNIKKHEKKYTEEFQIISDFDKTEINNLLKIFTEYLDNNNITYWIIGGTLLGSVRHGDFIPWDDDADIGIFENDFNKLIELSSKFNSLGYEIVSEWKIHKFRKIGITYPFVDIFLYTNINNTYCLNSQELREKWKNEYYTHDELFPLKKYNFGNLKLNGPNYPIAYLNRMYIEWQYFGIKTFNHKTMSNIDYKITLDYSNPSHKLKPYILVKDNVSKNKNDNPYLRELFELNYNKNVLIIL